MVKARRLQRVITSDKLDCCAMLLSSENASEASEGGYVPGCWQSATGVTLNIQLVQNSMKA